MATERQINSLEDLPAFASEEEEAEFWETHKFGPGLLAQMKWDDGVLERACAERRRFFEKYGGVVKRRRSTRNDS